jgi:hypothetical protein
MAFASDLKTMMQVKRLRMPKLDFLDRGVLIGNLGFMYHVMRASENLLHVGCEVARDPLLLDFYVDHLKEETGHADWLQKDLIEAGADFGTIPREAMLMAGVQYYLLYHVSPASLLGYMAALECFPLPLSDVEILEFAHGTSLLRTLRYHSEHDPDHGRALLDFIDRRPIPEHGAIMESALQACHFMTAASVQMMETASAH